MRGFIRRTGRRNGEVEVRVTEEWCGERSRDGDDLEYGDI